jgi:phosphoribosylanthranilate isomerase
MKIKVCGMRDADNIKELAALKPDFMGFIFYDKSPRFVADELDVELLNSLPKEIKKVGVFVNASMENILLTVRKYNLNYVQLHGNEMPEFCKSLKLKGVNIIKAFRIDNSFIFSMLNNYKPHVDFFLFDTKGEQMGGTGVPFDWQLLKKYDGEKPYFLAGGIDLNNAEAVENLIPKPYSIDVNSKFEIKPAFKDMEAVEALFNKAKPELMEVY